MNNSSGNSTIQTVALERIRVLRIAGDDRVEFLQGQLTQDVGAADPEHAVLAGWTSAKGRLLAVGQLLATPDALLWPLPADVADGVRRRLGMFVLRADVSIESTDHAVAGLAGLDPDNPARIGGLELAAAPGSTVAAADFVASRLIGDGTRALLCGPADELRDTWQRGGYASADENAWGLRDIRAGLPAVVAATSEAFIPQMLNLDLLGGISFTKGCYVGQEIVARTQNLGRIKRRMFRFAYHGDVPIEPGATIHGPDGATGKVVMTATTPEGREIAAVVAIDKASGAWCADEARTARMTLLPLPYAIDEAR